MSQVKYDMPEAQSSLEFILEQVIYGNEIIIVRNGVEIARITALGGFDKIGTLPMQAPYELR